MSAERRVGSQTNQHTVARALNPPPLRSIRENRENAPHNRACDVLCLLFRRRRKAEGSSKRGGGRWKAATGITRSRQRWHRHASRPGTTIVGERCSLRRIQRWKSAAVCTIQHTDIPVHACYMVNWNFSMKLWLRTGYIDIWNKFWNWTCGWLNWTCKFIYLEMLDLNFILCLFPFFILNVNVFKLFHGVLKFF